MSIYCCWIISGHYSSQTRPFQSYLFDLNKRLPHSQFKWVISQTSISVPKIGWSVESWGKNPVLQTALQLTRILGQAKQRVLVSHWLYIADEVFLCQCQNIFLLVCYFTNDKTTSLYTATINFPNHSQNCSALHGLAKSVSWTLRLCVSPCCKVGVVSTVGLAGDMRHTDDMSVASEMGHQQGAHGTRLPQRTIWVALQCFQKIAQLVELCIQLNFNPTLLSHRW